MQLKLVGSFLRLLECEEQPTSSDMMVVQGHGTNLIDRDLSASREYLYRP